MGRILHFGVGNFFRAHQAWYVSKSGGWRITGVSLKSSRMRDQLDPQGFRYSLVTQSQAGDQIDQIEVLDTILVAPEDPSKVLDAIADPTFEIISATITEKGYHLRSDGGLDFEDPDILHDLENPIPRTLIGYLARGLQHRTTPVTVLSCDNRSGNGDCLRDAVTRFASHLGLRAPTEIASFPNSMVDRITPATSPELIELLNAKGIKDAAPVPTEPFSEWVIEDNFANKHPDWEAHGVQLVGDVSNHELRKLRMLNGAHSYLAYKGILLGYNYVHQAIADPVLKAGVKGIMQEAAETLEPSMQDQARAYAIELVKRFENPALHHALRQIACDGSEKIRYRILDTIDARSTLGLKAPHLIEGLVAWLEFCQAEVFAGRAISDPRAEQIAQACKTSEPIESFASLVGFEPSLLSLRFSQ